MKKILQLIVGIICVLALFAGVMVAVYGVGQIAFSCGFPEPIVYPLFDAGYCMTSIAVGSIIIGLGIIIIRFFMAVLSCGKQIGEKIIR